MEQFTEADIMLIEKEISSKSYKDIAFLLDKPVEDLKAFLKDWLPGNGLIPFQQLQPEKEKRMPAPRKPREKKKPEPKIISRQIIQEQKVKRDRQGKPIFQTKTVDLSKLHQVRIDHKTCIYIKPGQDPEKIKKAYLKRLKESKSNAFSKDLV